MYCEVIEIFDGFLLILSVLLAKQFILHEIIYFPTDLGKKLHKKLALSAIN